jgi:hypothetical protein
LRGAARQAANWGRQLSFLAVGAVRSNGGGLSLPRHSSGCLGGNKARLGNQERRNDERSQHVFLCVEFFGKQSISLRFLNKPRHSQKVVFKERKVATVFKPDSRDHAVNRRFVGQL